MDRRTFLKTAAIGTAALSATGFSFDVDGSKRKPLKNWVWLTVDTKKSADEWKALFATMRESGVQVIVPEVYDGKNAFFPSTRLPVSTDLLGTMLPLAHAAGLEVHAWMWCMPCMIPEIMSKHPDWYNVNAKGESAVDKPAYVDYYKFLDPGRPEVREFIQGTAKELANIAELDGVHLDYIRHPDAILASGLWKKYNIVQDKVYPPYDYGYTDFERTEFKKLHGRDPMQIKDPTNDSDWMKFRYDMVTDLVNQYLVPAVHAKGKVISAAVFPGPTLAKQMVRQDWGRWNLDAFLPMLYNSFYQAGPEWVKQQTREGVSTVKRPVYSGLFIHDMDEPKFTQTVDMALKGGASGLALFSGGGMTPAKWKILKDVSKS
ncbi:MAG: hypothetical protein JWO20_3315 [Candidatus Angelobacter sp.]|jgi:uncharacterized lipoprotein YddW (UPF0748 family)|nr:hypothetical protein [Candidatus Angelobacter sp.]